jgi:hypothetical protein
MDPFSITVGCVSLLETIGGLSKSIYDFVKKTREAKSELYSIDLELSSLRRAISLIQFDHDKYEEDCDEIFPSVVRENLQTIMANCHKVLDKLRLLLEAHQTSTLGASIHWARTGKTKIVALKMDLSTLTGALSLAQNLVEV